MAKWNVLERDPFFPLSTFQSLVLLTFTWVKTLNQYLYFYFVHTSICPSACVKNAWTFFAISATTVIKAQRKMLLSEKYNIHLWDGVKVSWNGTFFVLLFTFQQSTSMFFSWRWLKGQFITFLPTITSLPSTRDSLCWAASKVWSISLVPQDGRLALGTTWTSR